MTIEDLMQQIQETERLITAYRNADEVIVGTQDQLYSRRGIINRTTLTAAEIGDQIVNILERRLAGMRAELENSAPDITGKTDDPKSGSWVIARTVRIGAFAGHERDGDMMQYLVILLKGQAFLARIG